MALWLTRVCDTLFIYGMHDPFDSKSFCLSLFGLWLFFGLCYLLGILWLYEDQIAELFNWLIYNTASPEITTWQSFKMTLYKNVPATRSIMDNPNPVPTFGLLESFAYDLRAFAHENGTATAVTIFCVSMLFLVPRLLVLYRYVTTKYDLANKVKKWIRSYQIKKMIRSGTVRENVPWFMCYDYNYLAIRKSGQITTKVDVKTELKAIRACVHNLSIAETDDGNSAGVLTGIKRKNVAKLALFSNYYHANRKFGQVAMRLGLMNELEAMQACTHNWYNADIVEEFNWREDMTLKSFYNAGCLKSQTVTYRPHGYLEPEVRNFAGQIVIGLQWIHSRKIVRSNLNLGNTNISDKGFNIPEVGNATFGIKIEECMQIPASATSGVMVPKVLCNKRVVNTVECWSQGATRVLYTIHIPECILLAVLRRCPDVLFMVFRSRMKKSYLKKLFRLLEGMHILCYFSHNKYHSCLFK